MSTIFPEGKYLTRCKEWALGATKKEEPQVFLAFEDIEGLGQPPAYYGQFGDKSLPHTMKALRACGWKGSDISELDHASAGVDANAVEIVVAHEEFEGVVRAKVRWVNAPGAGVTPLDPAKKASFAQALKAKILQLEQGQPRPVASARATQSGPPPGHPASDEIPF